MTQIHKYRTRYQNNKLINFHKDFQIMKEISQLPVIFFYLMIDNKLSQFLLQIALG